MNRMICEKCGKTLENGASFCAGCGNQINPYAAPAAGQPEKINTWLIPAILSAVLCCLPFGIVSIVFAAKANSALGCGDFETARQNGEKAKIWFWVAFGVGIVSTIFWIIVNVILAVAGTNA